MAVAGDRVTVIIATGVTRFGSVVAVDGSDVAKILLETLPPTDGPDLKTRGWRASTKRVPIVFIEDVAKGTAVGEWDDIV